MRKIKNYFRWLLANLKSIFVKKGDPITQEDKIAFGNQRTDSRKQTAKTLIQPLITGLEAYAISEDKLNPIIDYTCEFFAKNHKKMTYQRMLRKIVEHFRLEKLEKYKSKVVNMKEKSAYEKGETL